MISTSDLKKGARVEIDGEPYSVVDVSYQRPSARGGNTLVKTKMRNIKSGQLLDRTFKSGERLKVPDFQIKPAQYLYEENGDTFYFMDQESYEQYPLKKTDIEYELQFIRPNDEVRALLFNGQCIAIGVPQTVELEAAQTDPGCTGNTVNAATKPATMETGLVVQVPLFVETGSKLVIDTREARYIRRV